MSSKIEKIFALFLTCILAFAVQVPVKAAANESKNNYPIVLCHGCAGWGRDEDYGTLAYGLKYYWGGNDDFQTELINQGFTTYTAAVGPFSSNWDRACELYAEIKGGTVDYGEAHSMKYGHARYGRTYKGFYPQWGTKDDKGNVDKIHLIGHSQGGQTVRMLTTLLSEGSAEERAASGDSVSNLFKGGNSWVAGVVTLASPHDGTTLADLKPTDKLAAFSIGLVGTTLGNIPNSDAVCDLKLDQWGLKRISGESLQDYINRCLQSKMWASNDTCAYDLSTNGAVKQNRWVKAEPNVYYFSYACMGTMPDLLGHQIAAPVMWDKKLYNAQWAAQAAFMGSYSRSGDISYEIPTIGKEWWPNDGYVNTISENGPKVGSNDVIVNYNGTPQIGKWNFMGQNNIDHEDIIGRNWSGALNLIISISKMLGELPIIS